MLFILTFRVLFAICLIFKKFCVSCEPYTCACLDFCKHNCHHNTQNGFCFCSVYMFIHLMGEALVCIRLFHMFLYMQVPIVFILVCFSPWFEWNLSAQSLSIHRLLVHSAILSACTVCLFSSYLVGMVCPDSSCYCVSYIQRSIIHYLLIISLYLLIFSSSSSSPSSILMPTQLPNHKRLMCLMAVIDITMWNICINFALPSA